MITDTMKEKTFTWTAYPEDNKVYYVFCLQKYWIKQWADTV